MSGKLQINLTDLLRQRTVEGDRIEYKAGWNPDAILKTLCAFANDFENLGGGYVIIGQDCGQNRHPQMPGVVMSHVEAHDEAHDALSDTEVRNLEFLLIKTSLTQDLLTGNVRVKVNESEEVLT